MPIFDNHASIASAMMIKRNRGRQQDQRKVGPLEAEVVAIVGIGGAEPQECRDHGVAARTRSGSSAQLSRCRDPRSTLAYHSVEKLAQRDRWEALRVEREDHAEDDRREHEGKDQRQT